MNKILLLTLTIFFLAGCTSTNLAIAEMPFTTDYINDCSLDLLPGTDCLVLSGHNPDLDNSGNKEDIWEAGGLMVYQTVAQKYNITSTSTDDTLLGTGLRLLFVRGLDENFTTVTEVVSMVGTGTVQTVNKYLRPVFIVGVSGGVEQTNEGIITATTAITGDIQIQMDEDEAISKNSQFTVPINHTMIIKKIQIGVTKGGGQAPIVQVKGKVRFLNSNIWIETFDFKLDTSVADILIIDNPISNMLVGGSDFRLEVTADKDNVDVTSRTWTIIREDD